MNNVIADLGNAIKRDDVPDFRAGDTVNVHVKVIEGTRSRVQIFKGVVIRRHGGGIGETYTVRMRLHTAAERASLVERTPLWFYVLREAELGGGRLTGVGARIVAETFHRAMEGSTHSIVKGSSFRPSLGPDTDTFRMVDLLLVAVAGKDTDLAPLG